MTNLTYNILVIDDEPSVQSLLSDLFRREGYNVISAENGLVGLQLFEKHSPDLVLLDVRMPIMDGIETFKAIRSLDSNVLVIMITAYGTIETAVQAMKMGAFDYILKPFNIEELKLITEKARKMRTISAELTVLRKEVSEKYNINNIIHMNPSLTKIIQQAKIVSESDATVLLRGESGTGKDLLARYIHYNSRRAKGPFIKINCGALPESLVESELFGYEKGSFTGAIARKQGKFELAEGGTLFLDEIGEISFSSQVKILHALQYKEFERIGSTKTIRTDCRIIAATNKDLEEAIIQKEFREDLFYRLNVISFYLPPLRERKEDIPLLINFFLQNFSNELNKSQITIDETTYSHLLSYEWPGNIRELENTIERLVILTQGITTNPLDLPRNIYKQTIEPSNMLSLPNDILNPPATRTLKEVMADIEKEIIKKVLSETGGNRSKTAEKLGISRRSLQYKLFEYEITD